MAVLKRVYGRIGCGTWGARVVQRACGGMCRHAFVQACLLRAYPYNRLGGCGAQACQVVLVQACKSGALARMVSLLCV